MATTILTLTNDWKPFSFSSARPSMHTREVDVMLEYGQREDKFLVSVVNTNRHKWAARNQRATAGSKWLQPLPTVIATKLKTETASSLVTFSGVHHIPFCSLHSSRRCRSTSRLRHRSPVMWLVFVYDFEFWFNFHCALYFQPLCHDLARAWRTGRSTVLAHTRCQAYPATYFHDNISIEARG